MGKGRGEKEHGGKRFMAFLNKHAIKLTTGLLALDAGAYGVVFTKGSTLLGMTAGAVAATGWGLIALAAVLVIVLVVLLFRHYHKPALPAATDIAMTQSAQFGNEPAPAPAPEPTDKLTEAYDADVNAVAEAAATGDAVAEAAATGDGDAAALAAATATEVIGGDDADASKAHTDKPKPVSVTGTKTSRMRIKEAEKKAERPLADPEMTKWLTAPGKSSKTGVE